MTATIVNTTLSHSARFAKRQSFAPVPKLRKGSDSASTNKHILQKLKNKGWVLLAEHCEDSSQFSQLLSSLCKTVSFDPARKKSSSNTQAVDSGRSAIGLHIENGNTPLVPEIVAFYAQKAALKVSETTFCDGIELLNALPQKLLKQFSQTMTVSRSISRASWQAYVAHALNIADAETVSDNDLKQFLQQNPMLQGVLGENGDLQYSLRFSPLLNSNLITKTAFANAILGPSFNYEPPTYRLEDGSELDKETLEAVAELAEKHTQELRWRNGDVLILDNKRVMHGRRAILGAEHDRQLIIGMGNRG